MYDYEVFYLIISMLIYAPLHNINLIHLVTSYFADYSVYIGCLLWRVIDQITGSDLTQVSHY